jgi:hypothetical protein
MGVLKDLTDEYFGNRVREEDEVFRYSIDEKRPPSYELEPETEAFLRELAEHRLFLDKSLSFQINDLQRHTKLVLSGRKIRRFEYPNIDGLKFEIEQLDMLIKNLEDSLLIRGDGVQDGKELEAMLAFCKKQRNELEKAFDSREARPLLGLYTDNGDESVVTLFVDVIESITAGLDEMKLLLGQVMLHEYFHSFYYHVGVGVQRPMRHMEEPMAEYGSLMVLDSVASSNSRIASTAKEALEYSKDFIEKKQSCIGRTAAYGFGAYLYNKHKDDYRRLIAKYANMSQLLNILCPYALEYKYLLYPKYPAPQLEDIAFKKMNEFLEDINGFVKR